MSSIRYLKHRMAVCRALESTKIAPADHMCCHTRVCATPAAGVGLVLKARLTLVGGGGQRPVLTSSNTVRSLSNLCALAIHSALLNPPTTLNSSSGHDAPQFVQRAFTFKEGSSPVAAKGLCSKEWRAAGQWCNAAGCSAWWALAVDVGVCVPLALLICAGSHAWTECHATCCTFPCTSQGGSS